MTQQTLVRTGERAIVEQAVKELPPIRQHTQAEPVAKGQQCIWVERGVIAYRVCTHGYQCHRCEFGQAVEDWIEGV